MRAIGLPRLAMTRTCRSRPTFSKGRRQWVFSSDIATEFFEGRSASVDDNLFACSWQGLS